MRAQQDPAYAVFLRIVGDGATCDGDYGEIRLPAQVLSDGDLKSEVYGEMLRNPMSEDQLLDYLDGRAILTPLNVDCDSYNGEIVEALPGNSCMYRSADEIIPCSVKDGVNYPPEFLNKLSPTDVPPHELVLKAGAVVILIRNVNVRKGLCNGLRLLVVECGEHVLKCRIIGG
ncbi:Protein Y16E11A.2, partial [Aphelenchoides avenae]